MRKSVIAPLTAGVLLALAGPALAATKTTTFQVSANVLKNCVISAADLNLGQFDGANDLNTASSAITVSCTAGTTYNVGLNAGLTGSFTDRELTGPDGNTLFYNLYTTAGRTTVWNDSTNRLGGTGAGMASAQTLTVHGELLASKNTGAIPAGLYTDTITATIEY